jgi:hypothetical protein
VWCGGAGLVSSAGALAVLLGLLVRVMGLVAPEAYLDWRGVLLLAFGGFCLHVGVGSLVEHVEHVETAVD